MHPFVLLLLVLLFIYLAWRFVKDQNTSKRERESLFDDCLDLFEAYKVRKTPSGYPELVGRYKSVPFRLELIFDAAAFRKLPSLWLIVNLEAPLQTEGIVDYLVRPDNTEFYSPGWLLPMSLPIPESWPQHAILRTDTPDLASWLEHLVGVQQLFENSRMKELSFGRSGVRLVNQVKEANRATYTTMRYVKFDMSVMERESVRELLERAISFHMALDRITREKNEVCMYA